MKLYLSKIRKRGLSLEVVHTVGEDDVIYNGEEIGDGFKLSKFEFRIRKKLPVKKVLGLSEFRVSMFPLVGAVCSRLQELGMDVGKIQYRVQEERREGGVLSGVEGVVVMEIRRLGGEEILRELGALF
jgi:hypothetical protein